MSDAAALLLPLQLVCAPTNPLAIVAVGASCVRCAHATMVDVAEKEVGGVDGVQFRIIVHPLDRAMHTHT